MLFKVDALEREAFKVLRLVRSIKNAFAPMDQIPPEILLLTPSHYEVDEDDEEECEDLRPYKN